MRAALAALALSYAVSALAAEAPSAPVPEVCRASVNGETAVEVTHGGKSYRLRDAACAEQFESDPERFAQLYDALDELAAAGVKVAAPPRASLVPS